MSRSSDESQPKLVRALGTIDASAIVMGSMIGSGIFITSADVSRLLGAPGWLLLAWALSGLLTITGSICAAEPAAMMPKAGGQYVYLREAYGPAIGFLFGWSTLLVVQTGSIAAVAVAFAKFLGVFVPAVSESNYLVTPIEFVPGYAIGLSAQQLVALFVIVALTATNMSGIDAGKRIQNVFTFTKTAALVGLIVVGLSLGRSAGAAAWTSSWWNSEANGWSIEKASSGLGATGFLAFVLLFGKALIGPLFSQAAWNSVTFTGEETRDPSKTLPRALMAGCSSVVLLYLLANAAYVVSLPFDAIQNAPQDRVGTAAMQAALGDAGASIMAICILISTFGCVNGLILSGARVYYAMAHDGLFFRAAGKLNARQVPAFSLVVQSAWACFLVLPVTVTKGALPGTFEYGNLYGLLLDYITPVDLSSYILMVASVFVFRAKRPNAERPYRAWGYPITPAIYVGLGSLLVLDFVYLSPNVSGIGFLIALSGLPVYFAWKRLGRKAEPDALPE